MGYANATAVAEVARAEGKLISIPMAASQTIYEGSFVTIDSSGYAVFATVGASLPYAGVAAETVTTAAGEHTEIKVWTEGDFEFAATSAAQNKVGAVAYLSSGSSGNPQSVVFSDPGATELVVGRVSRYISLTKVRVRITGYAMQQTCAAS